MGHGARRYDGLTRAQLCQLRAIQRVQEREGACTVVALAAELRFEPSSARLCLRLLERIGLIARNGRSPGRRHCYLYVVTPTWRELAAAQEARGLVAGECAECHRAGSDLRMFRGRFYCPNCLVQTENSGSDELACPGCGARLDVLETHTPTGVARIVVTCFRCHRRGEINNGRGVEAAWKQLRDIVRAVANGSAETAPA